MFGKTAKNHENIEVIPSADSVSDYGQASRILLIDDDPIQLQIASSSLAGGNYQVTTANDGREGLEKLKQETFDLIVVDIDMPIMNGFDVIQSVRANPELAQLPIIVVSGNDQIHDIDRAFDEGATSFLNKPVNWNIFVQHIKFVLRTAQTEHLAVQTARQAQEASRAKSKVINQCLHRFGAQVFALDRIATKLSPETGTNALDELCSTNKIMAHALGSLNQTADILSGEIRVNDEPFALRDMLENIIKDCGGRMPVTFTKPDVIVDTLALRTDQKLIRVAIEALLNNVAAHCPPQTPATLTFSDQTHGRLVITLHDEGSGLPQSNTSTREKPEGDTKGLGLTVVRQIMKLLDGEFLLKSTPGYGVTASLLFPKSKVVRHVHH